MICALLFMFSLFATSSSPLQATLNLATLIQYEKKVTTTGASGNGKPALQVLSYTADML